MMPRSPTVLTALLFALGACRAEPAAPEAQPSASPAAAAPVATSSGKVVVPDPQAITCTWPVDGSKDTAASVLKRFGKDAKRATLPGPEGTELPGVILWDGDPARRIELVLADGGKDRVIGVMLRGERSTWAIKDLHIGDGIAKVATRNGKPFTFYGFDWDYGGYVSDWGGGRLEGDAKSCTLTLRFDPSGEDEPEEVVGDHPLKSNDPAAARARPVVSELSLNWP